MSISKTYIESSAVMAQLLGTPAAISKIVTALTAEGWAPGGGGGVTLTQVNNAVNSAVSGLSTVTYVDTSVSTALSSLPAGVTTTQMNTAIQNALNSLPAGVTTTQMNTAIANALATLPTGVTTTQMNTAISSATSGLQNSTQVGAAISSAISSLVTTTQMNTAISSATTNLVTTTQLNTAISGVSSGGGVSTSYVDSAISTALAGLPAYATMSAVNTAIQTALADVLHRPGATSDSALGADTLSTIGGNVLTNDTDPNGGTLSVTGISYSAAIKTVGTAFTTTYGTFTISSAGVWLFTIGTAARALAVGQTGTEVFTYTVTSSAGSSNATTLTLTITGTNNAPVVNNDTGSLPFNTTGTGNVLTNDSDPEGTALTVTSFSIATLSAPFTLGTAKTVTGMGTFTLSSNGAWTFVPVTDWSGSVPLITYVASDGVNTTSGTLSLNVSPAAPTATSTQTWYASYATLTPSNIAPNPLPSRPVPDTSTVVSSYPNWDWTCPLPSQVGTTSTSYDFRVGPGMEYTNISDVPWESLLPGDRVFIYWRATPYKEFISLTVRGTPSQWIEIIGVPNGSGQMPIMDGGGAVMSSSYNWSSGFDGSGLIICTAKAGTTAGWKPGYIHIHGIKFQNVRSGFNFTNRAGTVSSWGTFVAPIVADGVDHLTVTGCEMASCGLGIFVNSTPQNERFQSRCLHIAFNYIYGSGNSGSASEHNCYTEAIGSIYEFNCIESLIPGSWGLLVKERSAGVIFRYNYFESATSSTSIIGMEDPDSNAPWESVQVDSLGESLMSKAFLYGNTFVLTNVTLYDSTSPSIIAYGAGGVVTTANPHYRYGSLHVYNNVFISKMDVTTIYVVPGAGLAGAPVTSSIPVFSIDNIRLPTTVYARNNLFYGVSKTVGTASMPWALFTSNGAASFSQNWTTTFQNTELPYDTRGVSIFDGTGLGGLTASTADPGFGGFPVGDYSILPGSPYNSLTAPLHPDATARNLTVGNSSILYPFGKTPTPTAITLPTISPSVGGTVIVGTTLTGGNATWAFGVTSVTNSWIVNGVSSGYSSGYTPTSLDIGKTIVFRQVGSNSSGSTNADSATVTVVSATQPVNTVLPTITGVAMEAAPVSVTNGTWTNSPTSYTYEYLINNVVVATGSYTPVTADVGKTLTVRVTAHNATDTGVAMTAGMTVSAVSYDPDYLGVFNFTKPDGTTLDTFSPKFMSAPGQYSVLGDALQATQTWPGWFYYQNGQGDSQSTGGVIKTLSNVNSQAIFDIQRGASQVGYEISVGQTSVTLNENGTTVQTVAHSLVTPIQVDVSYNHISGVLGISLNGTSVLSHTFATPLTGGYPGAQLLTPGGLVSNTQLDSWYGR